MYYPASTLYAGAQMYYPPAAYATPAAQDAASTRVMVMESVRRQIEYYFSVENLCKDIFLRSKVVRVMALAALPMHHTPAPHVHLVVGMVRSLVRFAACRASSFSTGCLGMSGAWSSFIHSPCASCAGGPLQMDGEGYIPLSLVAGFNRVRMLTPDLALIVEALQQSATVELSPDNLLIRARDTWSQWVLPAQQRDPTAHAAVGTNGPVATPHVNGSAGGAAPVEPAAVPGVIANQVAAAVPAVASSPALAGPVAAAVQNVSPTKVAHSVPQQHGKPPTHPAHPPRKTIEADAEEDGDEDEDLFEMDEVREGRGEGGGGGHEGGEGWAENRGWRCYEQTLRGKAVASGAGWQTSTSLWQVTFSQAW
jgi:hypothetical protein